MVVVLFGELRSVLAMVGVVARAVIKVKIDSLEPEIYICSISYS
jgi:hypothetical protein